MPSLPEYFAFCAFLVTCGHVLGYVARGFEVDALKSQTNKMIMLTDDMILKYQRLRERNFHMSATIKEQRQRLAKFSPMSRKRDAHGRFES